MKRYLSKQLILFPVLLLGYVALATQNVQAQVAPPTQKPVELFAGYSKNLMQVDLASAPYAPPYEVITGQDLITPVIGYSLLSTTPLSDNQAYNAPYEPLVKTPNSDMPTITADTPTQFLLGKMLQTNISDDELKGYAQSITSGLSALDASALVPVSSSSSYNSVGNVDSNNAFTVAINQAYSNPYDSNSLFNYVPASASTVSGANNPAEIYISLVDGALTPVPAPSPQSDDFNLQMRRIAAIQTAGTNALQEIFDRSKPVLSDTDANNMMTTLRTLGDNSIKDSPKTPRDFEKIMATHRLDPNNTWYTHLQQATPVELQRQQLYLQAETLYELYQIRHEQEQNKLLLAVNLLAQNYQARQLLNVQAKMSPAAIKSLTDSIQQSS